MRVQQQRTGGVSATLNTRVPFGALAHSRAAPSTSCQISVANSSRGSNPWPAVALCLALLCLGHVGQATRGADVGQLLGTHPRPTKLLLGEALGACVTLGLPTPTPTLNFLWGAWACWASATGGALPRQVGGDPCVGFWHSRHLTANFANPPRWGQLYITR